MKHAKIHRINNMNKKLSDSFIKNNKTITITIIIITVFFLFYYAMVNRWPNRV